MLRIVKYHTQGSRHHGDRAAMPSPREGELEREVIELRKRLEVLERITTDANSLGARQSKSIADEIESLRDR